MKNRTASTASILGVLCVSAIAAGCGQPLLGDPKVNAQGYLDVGDINVTIPAPKTPAPSPSWDDYGPPNSGECEEVPAEPVDPTPAPTLPNLPYGVTKEWMSKQAGHEYPEVGATSWQLVGMFRVTAGNEPLVIESIEFRSDSTTSISVLSSDRWASAYDFNGGNVWTLDPIGVNLVDIAAGKSQLIEVYADVSHLDNQTFSIDFAGISRHDGDIAFMKVDDLIPFGLRQTVLVERLPDAGDFAVTPVIRESTRSTDTVVAEVEIRELTRKDDIDTIRVNVQVHRAYNNTPLTLQTLDANPTVLAVGVTDYWQYDPSNTTSVVFYLRRGALHTVAGGSTRYRIVADTTTVAEDSFTLDVTSSLNVNAFDQENWSWGVWNTSFTVKLLP